MNKPKQSKGPRERDFTAGFVGAEHFLVFEVIAEDIEDLNLTVFDKSNTV